ncbi:LSU ribosomal protein L29P [Pyrobaculum islandicum DSM 4184]|uniref:Large ribosomal subunit protein uL29 n=1 Tax=Pyrobaculum islandicum (strain DSM 4184 / JCM 9189 / GEO3) TaxID=384616 RepID=A1RV97_PYRIL|nr:50S ribosomal protein L29 [Pyrobaculum islandicum]ABL88879.1 LSU ribosomal protein L29P [Pyrobaculum islandicum DSM 4184]
MSLDNKRLKARVLREMKPEERRELLNQLRAELVKLETQRSRGFVENPGRIRVIKRAIARILTIEKEESRKAGQQKSS